MQFPTRPSLVRPTLLLLATLLGAGPAGATLVNRWSFTIPSGSVASGTAFLDAISGAPAIVRGQGATANGTAIVLPGSTIGNQAPSAISAYIDLPNGLVSSKTHLTLEIWATPLSYKIFGRLFDFGRVDLPGDGLGAAGEITGLATTAPGVTESSDSITLSLSRSSNSISQQRIEGGINDIADVADPAGLFRRVDTNLTTVAGTRYHYVIVYEAGIGAFASVGGRLSWYRDGVLAATTDIGFRLNQIEDVNNWLGRSLWSKNEMANVSYDEVRVYNRALTPAEITASRTAGPDVASPPVTQPDAVTIHPGQKTRIAVLANDTGPLTASTVVIAQAPAVGTATPDAEGRILYAHSGGDLGPVNFTYTVAGPGGTSAPATVTVTPSNQLRIPVATLNVPTEPPATAYQLVNALPGLTFSQPLGLGTVSK